jgi:SAM-dependent methyltransferase
LLAFIGQGAGDALDVGCGEWRVSRVLKECGYRVTAIDPVEKLISAAEQAGSADAYGIAAAADLPFENCSFDLAVAYNVLMDVEDVPGALKEIRRVLRPSGTLVISIVHPFADRGHFAGPEADPPFVLQRSYFGRERFEDTEVRNGLKCISLAGHSPWKAIWQRWRMRGWRSRHCASPSRTRLIKAATWSAGRRFPSSFG